MTWEWEYLPDEEFVLGDAPEAFAAQVEKKADELVRAAEAFYLDGTTYEGGSLKGGDGFVDEGMFVYIVVPRQERVYIRQVTPW